MRVAWCEGTRLAFVLIAGLIAAPAEAERGEPPSLNDVAVNSGPGVTTVLITTAGAPPYQATPLEEPHRLLIDFTGAEFAWRRSPLTTAADPVKEIRGSQYGTAVARLVIELTRKTEYEIEQRPDGLVVTLRAPGSASTPPIDPGRTPPAGAAAETAPAHAPAIPLLYGVIYGASGWIAYIEDPNTRAVTPYRVGDSVGGKTIEAIEDERVVLKGPEGVIEIKLGDEKPGVPKRPAEKAPSGPR
jgi:hypothetical protein